MSGTSTRNCCASASVISTSSSGAAIVSLIASGPESERTTFLRERGDSEQQIEGYGRHWRLRRYDLIAEHLGGEEKAEYDTLLSEFDKPDHPTFHSVITHWSGPTSPYTAEELSEMEPGGVVEALQAWIPPEGGSMDEYPKEGLARALEATVEKEAEDFATSATEFADLDPDYVRALLGGLAKAAREKAPFLWSPVLDLCERVAAKAAPDTPAQNEEAPTDWVRRTIVSLLSDGLNDGETEIPFEERARVWELIEPHLEDPDPSPAAITKVNQRRWPSTLSAESLCTRPSTMPSGSSGR
jgi:hypothetical protein